MTMADYDCKIGAPVLAAEGKVGQLKYVVVDSNAEVVTHLVVERGLVRLVGEVSEVVAQAATHLARWIRGGIGVEDQTICRGAPGFCIGAPVFARDGRGGSGSQF